VFKEIVGCREFGADLALLQEHLRKFTVLLAGVSGPGDPPELEDN